MSLETASPSNSISQVQPTDSNYKYGEFFPSSTHRELLYYHQTKSNPDLVISVTILLVQLLLYVVCLIEGLKEIQEDKIPVKIQFQNCKDAIPYFTCDVSGNTGAFTAFFALFLPALLVAAYTMRDMLTAIEISMFILQYYLYIHMYAFISIFFMLIAL